MCQTRKPTKRRGASDAAKIMDAMIGDDARLRRLADKAFEDAVIGQLIYDARARAGLTQARLARLIGTNQSVISRLEDADYRGHSFSMLRRVAGALGKRLQIRFVDGTKAAQARCARRCNRPNVRQSKPRSWSESGIAPSQERPGVWKNDSLGGACPPARIASASHRFPHWSSVSSASTGRRR
jgi:transcriptional regulator with XRE-family HTH domain